jgi:large subunit ribosomal protein L13
MDTLSYKTISANKETATKDWVIIDAENEILGRLASKVALLLRGKLKTNFTPHADCGDNVVIINAAKVRLTGNKMMEKEYYRHSQYPGGQTMLTAKQMMLKKPTSIVEKAIKGMLPKNKLSNQIFGNLYVYEGPEHKQEAQKPKKINLTEIK